MKSGREEVLFSVLGGVHILMLVCALLAIECMQQAQE